MKAWELIETKGWCQGRFAREADGTPADWKSPNVCLCAWGAIKRIYQGYSLEYAMLAKLRQGLTVCVTEWNDEPQRTKAEVVAKLKELDI